MRVHLVFIMLIFLPGEKYPKIHWQKSKISRKYAPLWYSMISEVVHAKSLQSCPTL